MDTQQRFDWPLLVFRLQETIDDLVAAVEAQQQTILALARRLDSLAGEGKDPR